MFRNVLQGNSLFTFAWALAWSHSRTYGAFVSRQFREALRAFGNIRKRGQDGRLHIY